MKIVMKEIRKSFGPVEVLKSVNFQVNDNEVHALIGENGAGKTTLVKVLTGMYHDHSGTILINGIEKKFKSVRDSEANGIAIVSQELNVFGEMTILENLFIGKEIRNRFGHIDESKQTKVAKDIFSKLGVSFNLERKVNELSVGLQQMLEIAKSLILDAELIVMDEPTSSLTDVEITKLFKVINLLKKEGKSFIYISHKLDEIFEICDSVTIMRDGRFILRDQVRNLTQIDIVKNMVGYDVGDLFSEKKKIKIGKSLLRVDGISKKGYFKNISFEVKEGEIIGFAGLIGSGRTDVMNAVFGINPADEGQYYLKGKPIKINSVNQARKNRIGYVTENRKDEGLFLDFDVQENVLLNNLLVLSNKYNVINKKKSEEMAKKFFTMVNLKYRDLDQLASQLSGGNQQKVVLAKWMANNPRILILDEPTRGIDVNSKRQIYNLIYEMKALRIGVIIVSSELVELLGVADKIYVMHEGSIKAEMINDNLSDAEVMKYMMGGEIYEG